MSSTLTKRIVLTAEPKERPYELRDAQVRGLILRVQPSGHKAWIVTWAHGKRRTLGSVEHLSLDQARDQARQAVAEYVQSRIASARKVQAHKLHARSAPQRAFRALGGYRTQGWSSVPGSHPISVPMAATPSDH